MVTAALLIGQGVRNQHAAAAALSLLTGSASKFTIVAVHAETGTTSTVLAELVEKIQTAAKHKPQAVESYYEFDAEGNAADVTHSLKGLLGQPEVEACIMFMLSEEQPTYLRVLRHNRLTPCHVFSLNMPAIESNTWMQLSEDFSAWQSAVGVGKNPHNASSWFVFEPSRFETAINKLKLVRDSIGTVLSAAIIISDSPLAVDPDLCAEDRHAQHLYSQALSKFLVRSKDDSNDRRLVAFTTVSAIVRRLLGDIVSVVGCKGGDKSATAAIIKTNTGILVTANHCSHPEVIFEVRLIGLHGEASLKWNPTTQLFECLREIGSFEHPSFLPPTGLEWALSSFADRALLARPEHTDIDPTRVDAVMTANMRSSIPESWVDFATAEAILRSDGVPVKFVNADE